MDPEKFIQLQKQMKENNEELKDFLEDFGDWKKDVEKKNKRLQNTTDPQSELPAIRNSLYTKKKKKHKKETSKSDKKERIKSFDYRAWDKFDVDKAIAEIDNESLDHKSASESETDEEFENRRRIQLAIEARELGNIRFKEEKLDEAIEHYTTAIRLAPEDPLSYTNRALAFLKTSRYASAETDCSTALNLDPDSVKALFRRALARKSLNKIKEAMEDLNNLLKINPNNKSAQTELTRLMVQFPLENQISATELNNNHSLNKSELTRKMKRIPIVEVGNTLKTISKINRNNLDSFSTNSNTTENKKILNEDNATFNHKSNVKSISSNNNQLPFIPNSIDNHSESALFSSPTNWFQLERELRELFGNNTNYISCADLNNQTIIYLCNIEPVNYAKLFGTNLETNFLTLLLLAFSKSSQLNSTDLIERLLAISRLPRFDVAWMLTDEKERAIATDLIDKIRQDNSVSKQLIDQIIVQFS